MTQSNDQEIIGSLLLELSEIIDRTGDPGHEDVQAFLRLNASNSEFLSLAEESLRLERMFTRPQEHQCDDPELSIADLVTQLILELKKHGVTSNSVEQFIAQHAEVPDFMPQARVAKLLEGWTGRSERLLEASADGDSHSTDTDSQSADLLIELTKLIDQIGPESAHIDGFLHTQADNPEFLKLAKEYLRLEREALRSERVLGVICGGNEPLAMSDIEFLAGCLGGYAYMEVRQEVWRLISANKVEMDGNLKIQPKGGCRQGDIFAWSKVVAAWNGVSEAKALLKQALSEMVASGTK